MEFKDLVKIIYKGGVVPTHDPNLGNAAVVAHNLPRGLDLSSTSMQFERAIQACANKKLKWRKVKLISKQQLYTTEELRDALRNNLLDGWTYGRCYQEFGVPEATLKRHIGKLATACDCNDRKALMSYIQANIGNEMAVLAIISDYERPKKGRAHLHDQAEIDILFAIADMVNSGGLIQSRRDLALTGAELCKEKAESLPDGPEKERYKDAVCGRTWVNQQIARITESLQREGGAGCKRVSQLSQKRAEAANPTRQLAMLKRIQEWYEELRQKNIEIPPGGPPAQQIWNGDETGFTTNANYPPSFTLGGSVRNFIIVPAERSKFWTTMFYWIRADGEVPVAPTVVHQGGTERDLPAKFTWGLPDDWTLHNTSSGYMDRSGFYYCVASLVRYIRKRDGHNNQHQFVFIDGHDSHFSSDAIDLAAENNIHVFFLKSNDSINDQPADMGANAILEKHYQLTMHYWKRKYAMMVPFSSFYMNEVLVTSFRFFLQDKKVIYYMAF